MTQKLPKTSQSKGDVKDMSQEMIEIPKKDVEKIETGFEEMKRNFQKIEKEIEEWEATIETLMDQDVMEQIRKSEKEFKEGKGRSWKEVRKEL